MVLRRAPGEGAVGEAPLVRGSAQRRGLYRNSYFYQFGRNRI